MTTDELIELIAANAKTGKWLSGRFAMTTGHTVGVKAFGKWVQILECNGIRTDVTPQKTLKSFKLCVKDALGSLGLTV